MTLRIAISGIAGRMGQAMARAALQSSDLTITGAVAREGSQALGKDAGVLAGLAKIGVPVIADSALAAQDADIWIDFSTPDATRKAMAVLEGTSIRAAIIGATGLDQAGLAAIEAASKRMAIVRSGNFSVGVNVLAGIVRQAAARLGPGWDIEIIERHHRRKVDAPSGTALMLGEAAATGRGRTLRDLKIEPRDGVTGSRQEGGIGIAVVRGGGIVGEHEVMFASETETLHFVHRASDRMIFADGALEAARWASKRQPGLYSMQDVLGL